MTAHRLAVAGNALLAAAILTACSSPSNGPEVPSLGSTGPQPTASGNRAAALHAAAQCIREHGVPDYQDPVLNADGQVFTDTRSLQRYAAGGPAPSGGKAAKGGKSTGKGGPNPPAGSTDHTNDDAQAAARMTGIRQACGRLMAVAGLRPQDNPPPPPALIAAGVTLAQCLRANGLPNVKDPTAASTFVPGHGFPMNASELPPDSKANPAFRRAFTACKAQEDEAIRLSTLGNLARG
jgi:hypothetical protein